MSTFTDADRHQQRDVANRAGAAALEPDFLGAGTRVVGAIPDEQSAHNRCRQATAYSRTDWSAKRYLNIELLNDQQMRGAINASTTTGRHSAQIKMCGKLRTHPRAAVSAIRVTASAS